MKIRTYAIALFLALLIAGAGFGSVHSVKATPEASISIKDSSFSPQEVTILVGSTILWKNNGTTTHTATSDTSVWDSGPIAPGGTYLSPVFDKVGVYSYHSTSDGSLMTGKVIVVPANANTLPSENVNNGLVVGYVLSILAAVIVTLWLNYPSGQAKAKTRLR